MFLQEVILQIGLDLKSCEQVVIKKVKNIVPWTYAIKDLHGEETVGTFYE